MPIELPAEQKQQAVASIRRYFAAELDQDVGELKAGLVLDYFLRELAPSVYNQAIADAQAFLRDRLQDLEATCYHAEFAYWPKSGPGKGARHER